MSPPPPLLSVIVPCLNPGRSLIDALESIWSQREPPSVEIIVIDGGSQDGTPAWLVRHAERLTHWSSERDRGVYDAMNRGLARARGRWVYFLGADDRLATASVLREAARRLTQSDRAVVAGRIRYDDGRIYAARPRPAIARRNFLHHQAAFHRREILNKLGGFDAQLTIAADYDLNLRLWLAGERIEPIDLEIARCGTGGLSDAGRWRAYAEEIIVRHRHLPAWQCAVWDAVSIIRWLRKRIIRLGTKAPIKASPTTA